VLCWAVLVACELSLSRWCRGVPLLFWVVLSVLC
jgi:hypothetical protein